MIETMETAVFSSLRGKSCNCGIIDTEKRTLEKDKPERKKVSVLRRCGIEVVPLLQIFPFFSQSSSVWKSSPGSLAFYFSCWLRSSEAQVHHWSSRGTTTSMNRNAGATTCWGGPLVTIYCSQNAHAGHTFVITWISIKQSTFLMKSVHRDWKACDACDWPRFLSSVPAFF